MLTGIEFWSFNRKITNTLTALNFEVFFPTNCKYAHGTEFWDFIRHITNNFKIQNFEGFIQQITNMLTGTEFFKALSEKLRTSSRQRILRFYPKNYEHPQGTEFWGFTRKLQTRSRHRILSFFPRQIATMLMAQNFESLSWKLVICLQYRIEVLSVKLEIY